MMKRHGGKEKNGSLTKVPTSGAFDLQHELSFVVDWNRVVSRGGTLGRIFQEPFVSGLQLDLDERVIDLNTTALRSLLKTES